MARSKAKRKTTAKARKTVPKKAVRKKTKAPPRKTAKKAARKAAPRAAKRAPIANLAGKAAPAFTMPADDGSTVSLAGLKGKRVVLYFYPKDDTPGCTAEACAFRDELPAFTGTGAVIIGVSKDNPASHRKFRDKFGLNFPLASDTSGVCEAYGVWKEKSMYGRKYMGIERSTFVIDEDGIVRAEWRKVSVPGHATEVKNALQSL
jgi:peroxiredoxin Q/BCP